MPLVVILALLFGGGSGGHKSPSSSSPVALPPLTPSAPSSNAATVAPCTKVLQALPERLGSLLPRVVHPEPDSLFVVAWGDPPVILRCGVARPADLKLGSSVDFILIGGSDGRSGVYFDITKSDDNEVYTSVDRAVYISISVPAKYSSPPVPQLAQAIATALPPVCVGAQEPGVTDPSQLCTHRK